MVYGKKKICVSRKGNGIKMNKPLVSYVVTTYNIEKYVEESVRCAFEQTYSPLEIVLSDDCSTDSTFEIMERMAKEYTGPHKIVLNRNKKNLGITKHMNKAYLELATGEIIVVAHGDDISDSNRTQVLVDYLSKHSECMQVACSAIVVDENLVPYSDFLQKNCWVSEERIYEFGSGAHVSVGFSAFRRKVMEFFGPLGDLRPTEDDPIGFRAIILGNIAYLPNKLVKYRKHAGSNSNPEQFARFPLDEIYNQNLRDMELAKSKGIIDSTKIEREKKRLFKAKEFRKVYRIYFANRTLKSLIKVVTYKGLTIKTRIYYIREHLEYLRTGN